MCRYRLTLRNHYHRYPHFRSCFGNKPSGCFRIFGSSSRQGSYPPNRRMLGYIDFLCLTTHNVLRHNRRRRCITPQRRSFRMDRHRPAIHSRYRLHHHIDQPNLDHISMRTSRYRPARPARKSNPDYSDGHHCSPGPVSGPHSVGMPNLYRSQHRNQNLPDIVRMARTPNGTYCHSDLEHRYGLVCTDLRSLRRLVLRQLRLEASKSLVRRLGQRVNSLQWGSSHR